MIYDTGDEVRLGAEFKDAAGAMADPTVTTLTIKDPLNVVTVLTHGIDAALVKASTGSYYCDLEIVYDGKYSYRWQGTGDVISAGESVFFARRSLV